MRIALIVAAVMLASLAAPGWAQAANGQKPRVAPVFVDAQCLLTVDRKVDPVLELPIAIPFEDDALTGDEPAEGRRFQFFAACRDHGVEVALPNWIRAEDVEEALALGLIEALPEPDDLLETSADWRDCLVPITSATERVPISCEATAEPVRWETSPEDVGVWHVLGYTYEPAQNLWTPRSGLVHVQDGEDDALAIALVSPPLGVEAHADAGYDLRGCTVAPDSAEIELAWASIADLKARGDEAWTPFGQATLRTGDFSFRFDPPEHATYDALYFRAEARWGTEVVFAYTHEALVFLPGCGNGESPAQFPDACGVADDVEPVGAPRSCEDVSPQDPEPVDEVDDIGESGGGCATGERGSSPLWIVLVGVAIRRKRPGKTVISRGTRLRKSCDAASLRGCSKPAVDDWAPFDSGLV